MVAIMPFIFLELATTFSIRSMLARISSPPCWALRDAASASRSASRVFFSLCSEVALISSMLAAVSCSAAACSSVREERSWAPRAISLAPI